jgi:hypothetical protein
VDNGRPERRELLRLLRVTKILFFATWPLILLLFGLLFKTLEEGHAFLENSDKSLELLQEVVDSRVSSQSADSEH